VGRPDRAGGERLVVGSTIASGSIASATSGGDVSAISSALSGQFGSPADMAHGPGENLLTGSDVSKATAAAEAAVPNGTVIRVETDSGGASYEAHMQKADGSFVTVKMDDSFNVTSTDDGFGPAPSQATAAPEMRRRGRAGAADSPAEALGGPGRI
jgi:hypothetical protein